VIDAPEVRGMTEKKRRLPKQPPRDTSYGRTYSALSKAPAMVRCS
jgi:hypothetical protein